MMKSLVSALLFALLLGVTAAFFRPAVPYQVETQPALFSRGGKQNLKDAGLDNPDIPEDDSITPARKCGFCIGVSFTFLLFYSI